LNEASESPLPSSSAISLSDDDNSGESKEDDPIDTVTTFPPKITLTPPF